MNTPRWTASTPPPRRNAFPAPADPYAGVAAALRAYGVAALGDLSPSRIVAIARAARVPNFRNAPRRRSR